MARAFYFLMQPDQVLSEETIFQDVSETIYNALRLIQGDDKEPVNIMSKSLEEFIF